MCGQLKKLNEKKRQQSFICVDHFSTNKETYFNLHISCSQVHMFDTPF